MSPSTKKEEFQWDVFISYSHDDSDIALRIRTALKKKRVNRVWIDIEQILPGDVFVKKIEDGLERSSAVAILISPASLESGWVEEEYTRAISLTKRLRNSVRVIPVVIKTASVPGFLANRSWVDFQDESRFEANIDLLAKGILRRPTDGCGSNITNATALLLSKISFLWFFPEGMFAGLYHHLIDDMRLRKADSQAVSRGFVQTLSGTGPAMVGANIEIVRELRALIKDPAKSAKELLTSIQRWVNVSGVFLNMTGLGAGRALLIRDLLTLAQDLTTDDGNDNLRSWVCEIAHNHLPDVAEQHLRIGVEISKGMLSAACPQTASDYLVLAHLLLRIGEARQAADIFEIYRGSDLFDHLGLNEEKRINFALDWAKATKDAGRGRQMHTDLIAAYDQMLLLLQQVEAETEEEKNMIARAEADLLNNTATQIAQFGTTSSEWAKAEKSFAQTYDIYRRLKDTDRLLGARANQVAHSLDHLERQKTKPSEEQLRSLLALLEQLNSDAEKTPASENLFFFFYQKARVLKRLYAEDAMQAAEVYKQAADVAEEAGLPQRVQISRCWELRLRQRADEIAEDDYLDGLQACAASLRTHTDDAWSSSALANVLLDIARILRNRRANVEAWNALTEAFDLEVRRVVSSQSSTASDRLKQILKAMSVVNFTDEQRVVFLGKNAPLLKKLAGVSNHKKLEWSVVTEWLKQ